MRARLRPRLNRIPSRRNPPGRAQATANGDPHSMTDTLLVTGGAGFIGSNFVRHALGATAARLVVVDKLTYAGNLASLAEATPDPRVAFVQADIADGAAMA